MNHKKINNLINKFNLDSTFNLETNLRYATPVDTGEASRGWHSDIKSHSTSTSQSALAEISNYAEHVYYLEVGTKDFDGHKGFVSDSVKEFTDTYHKDSVNKLANDIALQFKFK